MTQHTVQLSLTEDEYEQLVYLLDPGKVDWEREINERILVRKLLAAWDQAAWDQAMQLHDDRPPFYPDD
jgi:hypothetical protein